MTSSSGLRAFERTLARVMLTGVWLSAACLAVALSVQLMAFHVRLPDVLLRIGLVILMATPVMRVFLSVTEAIRQKDWFWLWTTIAVTVILAGTMVYSLRSIK
jgi:hypothetical protein